MNVLPPTKRLIENFQKYDVILIGTHVYNSLQSMFQRELLLRFPIIDETNRKTKYGDLKKLGTRKTIYDTAPIFSLCYISQYKRRTELVGLDYEALENCIATANIEFRGKNIATMIMGSTKFDGNGDKDKILHILENNSNFINLDIYQN